MKKMIALGLLTLTLSIASVQAAAPTPVNCAVSEPGNPCESSKWDEWYQWATWLVADILSL